MGYATCVSTPLPSILVHSNFFSHPVSKRLEAIEESKALGVERAKVNEEIEVLKRRSYRLDQLEQEAAQKREARAQEEARQIQLPTQQAEHMSL